jgi:hypothetical protein
MSEERGQLGGSVPRGRFAEHLPDLGVESGIPRQGAVTKVLIAVPFCASRGQRQNRILAMQGLDGGLLNRRFSWLGSIPKEVILSN